MNKYKAMVGLRISSSDQHGLIRVNINNYNLNHELRPIKINTSKCKVITEPEKSAWVIIDGFKAIIRLET